MNIVVNNYRVPVFEVFTVLDIVKGNSIVCAVEGTKLINELDKLEDSKNIKLFKRNETEYILIRFDKVLGVKGKLINLHLYSDTWLELYFVKQLKKFIYSKTVSSRVKVKSHPKDENNGKYITIRNDENHIEINGLTPRPFSSFTYNYIRGDNVNYSKVMFKNDISDINHNPKSPYFIIHLGAFDAYVLITKSVLKSHDLHLSLFVPSLKYRESSSRENKEYIMDEVLDYIALHEYPTLKSLKVSVHKGTDEWSDQFYPIKIKELFNNLDFFSNSYIMIYVSETKVGTHKTGVYSVGNDGITHNDTNMFIPKEDLVYINIRVLLRNEDNLV